MVRFVSMSRYEVQVSIFALYLLVKSSQHTDEILKKLKNCQNFGFKAAHDITVPSGQQETFKGSLVAR